MDGRVLDLGCGDGSVSRSLLTRGNRLTLVDRSALMLDHAKAMAPVGAAVEFIQADILDYVPDAPSDAVLCVGVMAHVASGELLVAKAAEAIRDGGLCVVQITDEGQPLGRLRGRYYRLRYPERGGRHETALRTVIALAARHRLDVCELRRYGLELPGSGCLPFSWQRRIEAAAVDSRHLSRLTAEVLICLRKRAADTA